MSTRRYLSPLRYPGGKARMAAALARVFAGQHSTMDVEVWMEPFAGGAGAGLHLLDNGDVAELWLTEKHPALAALWSTALGEPEALARRVETTTPDMDLVLGTGTRFGPGAYDVARAPVVPGLTRVDSWEDLHDRVLPPARFLPAGASEADMARAREKDFAPKITDLHRALGGTTPAGRKVVVASRVQQVRDWAAKMHHCIASYQMPMFLGRSVLGAVLDADGTMVGNFEVKVAGAGDSAPVLVQLLGPHNATLPREALADVEEHLRAAGVAVTECWGRHGQAAA